MFLWRIFHLLGPEELQVVNEALDSVHGFLGEVAGGVEEGGGVRCPVGAGHDGNTVIASVEKNNHCCRLWFDGKMTK